MDSAFIDGNHAILRRAAQATGITRATLTWKLRSRRIGGSVLNYLVGAFLYGVSFRS